MLSRIIIQHLIRNNLYTSNSLQYLYKILKRIEIKKILWLDQQDDKKFHTFSMACIDQNYLPKIHTKPQQSAFETHLPEVNLYHFNHAIINTHSSHLIFHDHAVLERITSADIRYCNYATGIIRFHHNKSLILKRNKKKINIPKALYLGGNGVFNYYHWLIEISPKLLLLNPELLRQYNIELLILDQKVQATPSFQTILKLYLEKKNININILYMDYKTDIHVENLLYINNLNNIVFNSKEVLSSPSFSCISAKLINTIRTTILTEILPHKQHYPKRIFLARKQNTQRTYNQRDVLDYFIQQGFSEIYLEDYPFDEQVAIFNQAEFIVGPSGAAWSNIIFCTPHCKAISWLPYTLTKFSIFSTLAAYHQCDLRFLITNTNHSDDIHSSYTVEVNKLCMLYNSFCKES